MSGQNPLSVKERKRLYREANREKISENYKRYTKEVLHPDYGVWKNMKARCNNKNHASYKNYGGRGIKVCFRWNSSFQRFIEDMGPRPEPRSNYSLDRYPDRDGNYEPGNCRWADYNTQNQNTRKSVSYKMDIADDTLVYYLGDFVSLLELSQSTGIPLVIVKYRYVDALIKGIESGAIADFIFSDFIKGRKYFLKGRCYTTTELAMISGLTRCRIKDRINKLGWTAEQAITCS